MFYRCRMAKCRNAKELKNTKGAGSPMNLYRINLEILERSWLKAKPDGGSLCPNCLAELLMRAGLAPATKPKPRLVLPAAVRGT